MAKQLLVEGMGYSLEVEVADDVDLDGEFEALCLDTGEKLQIKGWLIDNVEDLAA